MSEEKLSDVLGIDQSAEEALGRAGVRSLKELGAADPETLATTSGIPVDRIREWQRKAHRSGARPGPSPVAKAWMVAAIAVVIALALGWAMMAIGARRVRRAEQLRVAADAKLDRAVEFAAQSAVEELRRVRLAIHARNWGNAESALVKVASAVRLIEQVAPERSRGPVAEVRKLMDDLDKAVVDQAADASARLDALEAGLDRLQRSE